LIAAHSLRDSHAAVLTHDNGAVLLELVFCNLNGYSLFHGIRAPHHAVLFRFPLAYGDA
jgi:hypothetical protein